MHEGGEKCLKYLKGGGPEKRGVEIKIFKKGGKLGQEVDALKGGGGGRTLLRTMVISHKLKPELKILK